MAGQGEEISVTVRWKRPMARAARTALGAAAVIAALLRWWPAERSTTRDDWMEPTIDWSCDRVSKPRSLDVTEQPNADGGRNDETGADEPRGRKRVVVQEQLTRQIINVFYHVYHRLHYGKLESVYRSAMAIEFRKRGIRAVMDPAIRVWYEGEIVGVFRADFVVEDRVVVELRAGRALDESAHAQLINNLSCADIEVGLLLHYGPTPQFRRAVYMINRERGEDPP